MLGFNKCPCENFHGGMGQQTSNINKPFLIFSKDSMLF